MQEVTIRLRFNRECLGSAKRRCGSGNNVRFCFPRDPRDRVMFLPSWWSTLLRFASRVANHSQGLVRRVDWDPVIDGLPAPTWKRNIVGDAGNGKRVRFAVHEAFKPGDSIGVNAILPDGLTLDAFKELLDIVGSYKGISPFQRDDERYGTFEVLSVRPTVRCRPTTEIKSEACQGAT